MYIRDAYLDPYMDVTLPASQWLERYVIPHAITPNMVSLFGVVYLLLITVAYIHGQPSSSLSSIRLWMASGIFVNHLCDDVDGVLARARGIVSSCGEFLDHGSDRLIFMIIYFTGLASTGNVTLVAIVVCIEGVTGFLKLYGNWTKGEMCIDSTGEWLRIVSALLLLLPEGGGSSSSSSLQLPVVVFIGLALRQMVFQLRYNFKDLSEFRGGGRSVLLGCGVFVSQAFAMTSAASGDDLRAQMLRSLAGILVSSTFMTFIAYQVCIRRSKQAPWPSIVNLYAVMTCAVHMYTIVRVDDIQPTRLVAVTAVAWTAQFLFMALML